MRDRLQPPQLVTGQPQQGPLRRDDGDLPVERFEEGLYRRLDALEALAVSLGLMTRIVTAAPPDVRANHE